MTEIAAASPETTTPAAPAAPANAGVVTDAPQTATAFDWKALNLAPELQNVVDNHQFKDPAMVVKSFYEFKKLYGVPPDQLIRLPLPKDAADPKAWDPIYNKLGRPETPDKYVLPLPKGDDGTFANAVKPWLHEAGVSQSGAAKLAEKWNSFQEAQRNAVKAEREATDQTQVQELKQAWGTEYDSHAALVDKAAESFGMTQEQLNALKQTMGPKAAMEFLFTIGKKLGAEDTTVPGMSNQATGFNQMTPDMAKAEIARLKGDKDFTRMFSSDDPKTRAEARRDMDRLHKIAYPGVTKSDAILR